MTVVLRRWPSNLGAAVLRALVLVGVAAVASGAPPGAAQSFAAPGVMLPPGLASVWRVDGRRVNDRASAWSLVAFSTDGRLVGVSDEGGTRVYRASDGRLQRSFPASLSTGQSAFSLAISSTGLVATGRVGGLEIHELDRRAEPLKYHCSGICGPVSALAFSPNGALLAFQAAHGALEPTPGIVNVVDLRKHARRRRARGVRDASGRDVRRGRPDADRRQRHAHRRAAARSAYVGWSGGVDWRRVRDEPGAQVPLGSIGPFAFDDRVAAYSYDGRLELRELASGALAWAAQFVPPGLDAVVDGSPMQLELVAFARRGDLVLTYESPESGAAPGTLVFRRMADGETVAMYDVPGVSALAVAPDGASFMYSTGAGRTYTVLARVPR